MVGNGRPATQHTLDAHDDSIRVDHVLPVYRRSKHQSASVQIAGILALLAVPISRIMHGNYFYTGPWVFNSASFLPLFFCLHHLLTKHSMRTSCSLANRLELCAHTHCCSKLLTALFIANKMSLKVSLTATLARSNISLSYGTGRLMYAIHVHYAPSSPVKLPNFMH